MKTVWKPHTMDGRDRRNSKWKCGFRFDLPCVDVRCRSGVKTHNFWPRCRSEGNVFLQLESIGVDKQQKPPVGPFVKTQN